MAADPILTALHAAMDACIVRFWRSVIVCPACQQRFVKEGKRKFCSRRCAARAHLQAFHARHPRDYRAEHLARQRLNGQGMC